MKTATYCSGLVLLCGLVGALACETKPETEVPWGPEQDGVRMRLVPLVGEFHVGKPMPFRLEMKNVSERAVSYDSQAVGTNDSFVVKRATGADVPYIGGSVQTTGGARPLKPGQVVMLVPTVDVAGDYLITEPGAYRIQFRRQGSAFGTVRFPESNVVEVKVGKGKLRLPQVVAARLSRVLPDKRWEVSLDGTGIDLVCNRTGLKADVYYVSLLLEKERLKGKRAAEYELLGSRDGMFVYMSETPGGEEIDDVWAGHRKAIVEAVGVRKLKGDARDVLHDARR